ncbi:MAG: hypothetical protein IPM59_15430 [Chloracidobacterium sp.]|nr:hypothetical protein [Chloracidobacterium sp.]
MSRSFIGNMKFGNKTMLGKFMELRFPIKTVSEANTREHWALKHRRKKAQQADFAMLWRYHKAKVTLPAVITFTRYSCNLLDADNLAGAFKHVQDQPSPANSASTTDRALSNGGISRNALVSGSIILR